MKKSPSLFFPLTLIAAGVIWLLVQMNIIPSANLWALTHIWPLLLIALGLGLILRNVWREGAGVFITVLVVAGAVLAVVYAPQLGWADAPADWNMGEDFTGAVAGSGKIKTETREVKSFDAVSIDYPAEVLIVQGKYESVKFEADDNLLRQLSAEVSGGNLVIKNKENEWSKRVKPSQPVKITITVKDLRNIEFPTAGKVRVEDLEGESLNVDLSGAGEINLTGLRVSSLDCNLSGAGSVNADGTADQVKIEIDGFGSFNGKKLQSVSADVTINGAGNVNLKVKTSLTAEINGAGSVKYYGSPKVNSRINGAGSVDQLGK